MNYLRRSGRKCTPNSLLSKHLENHLPISTWPRENEDARESTGSCNGEWRHEGLIGTFCATVVAALDVWH